MSKDAFSKCHPAVNFLFFVGAIGSTMLIQHPAYLLAGLICGGIYYLLLNGTGGWRMIIGMIPLFLILTVVNPLLNIHGQTVLFTCFSRPYTLEALYYGGAIAAVFAEMVLWIGCCNAVLTSDKFTSLFGNLIPALSLILVMTLRLIPGFLRKGKQISGARSAIGKGLAVQDSAGEKLTEGLTVLGCLTSWALEGSIVTADSMRSRGYGSGRHTSFMRYTMNASDWILTGTQISLLALMFSCGDRTATYTPDFYLAPITGIYAVGLTAYWAFLLIPAALHIKEALQWHISISRI